MKNSIDDARTSKYDIEWLKSRIDSLESLIEHAQLVDDEILYCVKDLQQDLHCLQINRDQLSPQQSMVEYSWKPCRPRFQVYSEKLRFLLSLKFSVTDIVKFFGVSVCTVHRRKSRRSLCVSNLYSTDQELALTKISLFYLYPLCRKFSSKLL